MGDDRRRSVGPAVGQDSDWREAARCAGRQDLDWDSSDTRTIKACKAICATCDVQDRCLTEAMHEREPWGIWGGHTVGERKDLASELGIPPPAHLPPHGTNSRYAKHGCRCNNCRHAHKLYERARLRERTDG